MEHAMMADAAALADLPDLSGTGAENWAEKRAGMVRGATIAPEALATIRAVTGHAPGLPPGDTFPAVQAERRFVLAALVADFACYPDSQNRETYAHLAQAVRVFPRGFRVWLLPGADGPPMPAGYTGWHPIRPETFALLRDHPDQVTDRRQIEPIGEFPAAGRYAYLYNASIVPALHRTPVSRALMRALAADIRDACLNGLAAVTVSMDGQRIADRFGLRHAGSIKHEGFAMEAFATPA